MITITIILILIISLVSITAFNQPGTMSQLQFNAYRVYHHKEYYRLLTHAFVHAGWEHLIVNMIVLWSFGTAVVHYFRNEFGNECDVLINSPYAGGFISISHRWHRDIPWIQIEVNRGLYERETYGPDQPGFVDKPAAEELKGRIWDVLSGFWDNIS